MRVVVTGGGTGGHAIPAFAVMDRCVAAGWDVLYVGSQNGVESKMLSEDRENILLNVSGVKGKSAVKAAKGLFLIGSAFARILTRFLRQRPRVVIGTGGFVCIPSVTAGFVCGAKIYLQEQNAVPGAAVKYLAPLARKIFCGFADAARYLPAGKAVVSGNPLRREFLSGERMFSPPASGEKLRVLVLGGSQGAGTVNRLVKDSLRSLNKEQFEFIHQTGEKDREEIEKAYAAAGFSAEVFSFKSNIHEYYRAAHCIIARSGAMTVAEITAVVRPSILIPFPHAIYDHQAKNAAALADIGAAYMFREADITPEKLGGLLHELYRDPAKLSAMAERLRALPFRDAAQFIVDTVREDARV